MNWGVDVPVHHRGTAGQTDFMCSGHDVNPGIGGQLALRQDPANVVVEDLGSRARNGVHTGGPSCGEPLSNRDPGSCRAVDDLHWAEGMQVDLGLAGLHRSGEIKVSSAWQIRVDAPCMQISVAPADHASSTRSPISVGDNVNASASLLR